MFDQEEKNVARLKILTKVYCGEKHDKMQPVKDALRVNQPNPPLDLTSHHSGASSAIAKIHLHNACVSTGFTSYVLKVETLLNSMA